MLKLENVDGKARAGVLETKHGKIKTPFFMPIATKGAIKHISMDELNSMDAECIIANAFIMYLRPGVEVIKEAGGLHKFMRWDKAMFTDSGGFQILSKDFLVGLSDKGVKFRNPYTGKIIFVSPEDVIKYECELGGDVIMTLDDVPHYGNSYDYILKSMIRTHKWARRCKKAWNDKGMLFGICQGGTFKDLREHSAKIINSLDFDGVALGGLAIGEGSLKTYEAVEWSVKHISEDKTRYLMGCGNPKELVETIVRGVDCYDSRFPTQNARHGNLFTKKGSIRIDSKKYEKDFRVIDEDCGCYVCKNFNRAFLHHLFKTKEPIRERYASIHNLHFVLNLVKECRKAILGNYFEEFRKEILTF